MKNRFDTTKWPQPDERYGRRITKGHLTRIMVAIDASPNDVAVAIGKAIREQWDHSVAECVEVTIDDFDGIAARQEVDLEGFLVIHLRAFFAMDPM